MRTRVLVTDGKNTIQVYWVEHTGSDVYFGMSGINGKRSYHASGKQHSNYFGKKLDDGTGIPLKEIKRVRPLSNLLVGDLIEQVKIKGERLKYSGRKATMFFFWMHVPFHVELNATWRLAFWNRECFPHSKVASRPFILTLDPW